MRDASSADQALAPLSPSIRTVPLPKANDVICVAASVASGRAIDATTNKPTKTLTRRAENVRAALRFVETGDAAAGIVYFTDARASGEKVVIVGEFPQSSFPKISYPLAALKGGQSHEAKAFAAFLRSAKAQAIFRSQGFITP